MENLKVNKQRILRLRREHHLLVPPNLRLQARRTAMRHTPKPARPHEWWGIEMTKVMGEGFGWGSIVVILDWYTKKLVGSYAGMPCAARHWLAALDMAVNRQCSAGARGQGLSLLRDHGCQPTAAAFMRAGATLQMHQAFTSDHNPKGNADTERVMRTLKEAWLWLREWTGPFELSTALEAWMITYHEQSLHSALGDNTPKPFEQDYYSSPSPPFLAA